MDGVLKVNVVNFVTVGLMAVVFTFVANKAIELVQNRGS